MYTIIDRIVSAFIFTKLTTNIYIVSHWLWGVGWGWGGVVVVIAQSMIFDEREISGCSKVVLP